ncbi:MAG: hypothetical protein ABI592_08415 [Acidobacteriota bacterium]
MATAWVYVINDGGGVPRVVRRSHSGITVQQQQAGVYLVTFPTSVRRLACVATLNNSVGTITAIPGDNAGLPANQVTVVTLTLQNQARGIYDFSLAVFYNPGARDVVTLPPGGLTTALARAGKKRAVRKSRAPRAGGSGGRRARR